MKDKLLKFVPIIFVVVIIWNIFMARFMAFSQGTIGFFDKPSFAFNPDDVAVSARNVYLIDDSRNEICAYDLDGNFLYMISFDQGSGRDYVYVNENGNLCRLRVRGDVLYEFDHNGQQINKTVLKYGLPKNDYQSFSRWEDIQVQLEKSLFHPTRVVVNRSDRESITFAVQTTGCYLLKMGIIVFVIVGFLLALLWVARKLKNKSEAAPSD